MTDGVTMAAPPVFDFVIGLQFDPLVGLRSPQILRFWEEHLRADLPDIEERAPLEPLWEVVDGRGIGGVQMVMANLPPVPRYLFSSTAKDRFVQLQSDRIILNWNLQAAGEDYPRYARMRERFQHRLTQFQAYLRAAKIGDVVPQITDLHYFNCLPGPGITSGPADLPRYFKFFAPDFGDSSFGLEGASIALSFRVPGDDGRPVGRLRLSVNTDRKVHDTPTSVFEMFARGFVERQAVDDVLPVLDRCHAELIRKLKAVTTAEVRRDWGVADAR